MLLISVLALCHLPLVLLEPFRPLGHERLCQHFTKLQIHPLVSKGALYIHVYKQDSNEINVTKMKYFVLDPPRY